MAIRTKGIRICHFSISATDKCKKSYAKLYEYWRCPNKFRWQCLRITNHRQRRRLLNFPNVGSTTLFNNIFLTLFNFFVGFSITFSVTDTSTPNTTPGTSWGGSRCARFIFGWLSFCKKWVSQRFSMHHSFFYTVRWQRNRLKVRRWQEYSYDHFHRILLYPTSDPPASRWLIIDPCGIFSIQHRRNSSKLN